MPRKPTRTTRRVKQAKKQDVEHFVERFSEQSLTSWRRAHDILDALHYNLHYSLEAKRASRRTDIIDALQSVGGITIDVDAKPWWRVLSTKYAKTPFSTQGSQVFSGRFNYGRDIDPDEPTRFPVFGAVYLASDKKTAELEFLQTPTVAMPDALDVEDLWLTKKSSVLSVRVQGQLVNVFDATKPANVNPFVGIIKEFPTPPEVIEQAKQLGHSPPRLIRSSRDFIAAIQAENWRYVPAQHSIPAPCQIFGRLVRQAGYEGVLYKSIRTRKKCVALYPDNFSEQGTVIHALEMKSITPNDTLSWATMNASGD